MDLEALREPSDVGRRLDVGGFVLSDPFEQILRKISADYLREAWERLSIVLGRHRIEQPDDLSWGHMHAGETEVPGATGSAPSGFTGWTSRRLVRFDEHPKYARVDEELGAGTPKLRCAVTWRSSRWMIAPDDYGTALRLIEELWTGEPSGWAPVWLLGSLADRPEQEGAWLKVARAIRDDDQWHLDQALAEARAQYSPLGYCILLRGFEGYVDNWKDNFAVRVPPPWETQ